MKTIRLLLPALAALAFAPTAEAAIIYSGLQNIPIPFTFSGVYFNPLTLATASAEPVDYDSSPWMNLDFAGVDISNGNSLLPVVTGGGQVLNVGVSIAIDSSSNFAAGANGSSTHLGSGVGQFMTGTSGYIGFSMTPSGGPAQYGWVQVQLDNTATGGTIIATAYESTPGLGISAGAVPEPGTGIALVLGLLGTSLRRRRAVRG